MLNLLALVQHICASVYRQVVHTIHVYVCVCVCLLSIDTVVNRVNWPSRADLAGPGDLADLAHVSSTSA